MTQLIQATILISIGLIFYRALLEKETYYQLNRWILLSLMLLACILPISPLKITIPLDLPIPADVSLPFSQKEIVYTPEWESAPMPLEAPAPISEATEIPFLETVPQERPHSQSGIGLFLQNLTLRDILLYLYFGGVAVMFIHFFVQLTSLVRQINLHPKSKDGKYILVNLNKGKASYSFFNFIFINPAPLDTASYQQILSHERIHVDQKHSLDILLSQILLISQWFNPFAWIYKKKVKQNLEYLTDDLMLKQGTDITDYQFSLLRVSAPEVSGQLVLNYSQSLLKKRILMMNAKKSSLRSIWKYAFLFPVLALSFLVLVAEKAPDLKANEQQAPVEQPIPETVDEQASQNIENASFSTKTLETNTQAIPLFSQTKFQEIKEITGNWEGKIKEGELCLRIIRSISDEGWNWMHHDCYEQGEFNTSISSSTTHFSLKKKSGSLNFEGTFTGQKGEGKFQFVADDSYRRALANKGIKNASDALLFRLFFTRDEKKFLDNIAELQKLGLDDKTLAALTEEGVKADLVKGYQDEGLSVPKHLSFIKSRVKANLIKSYYDAGLDLEKHKGFIHSRVKPSLLTAYKDAGLDLEAHKSFINSRVKPELLTAYKNAGFSLNDYKDYINSRVKPQLLKDYQSAGLDINEYKSYIHSRVKPELLKAYKDAGFAHADYTSYIQSRVKPDLLKSYQNAGLSLKEHHSYIQSRVKPEFLKEYQDVGYDLDTYRSYIQSRVKPSLLKSYEEAGLDLEEYNSYIQSRIKPELLKDYEAAGFSPDTYRSYVHSRVKPTLLKSYQEAGFDLEENKSFIQSRVPPSLLKGYMDAGFDLDTYKSYIHSRIKPDFLKAYQDAGLSLEKNKTFIQHRVRADVLINYKKAGYDLQEYKDFINYRIKASFLKKYEAAGLDIMEHKDFIMDRVDPETVKKYRDAQRKKN